MNCYIQCIVRAPLSYTTNEVTQHYSRSPVTTKLCSTFCKMCHMKLSCFIIAGCFRSYITLNRVLLSFEHTAGKTLKGQVSLTVISACSVQSSHANWKTWNFVILYISWKIPVFCSKSIKNLDFFSKTRKKTCNL